MTSTVLDLINEGFFSDIDVHGVELTEEHRILRVHALLNPARGDERVLGVLVERGVQIDGDRIVVPGTSEVPVAFAFCEVYDLTVVEDVAELHRSARSDDGAAACTVGLTGLE